MGRLRAYTLGDLRALSRQWQAGLLCPRHGGRGARLPCIPRVARRLRSRVLLRVGRRAGRARREHPLHHLPRHRQHVAYDLPRYQGRGAFGSLPRYQG